MKLYFYAVHMFSKYILYFYEIAQMNQWKTIYNLYDFEYLILVVFSINDIARTVEFLHSRYYQSQQL